MSDNYNGWANYHTWNVALWINNEESVYKQAVGYASVVHNPTYNGFVRIMEATLPDHLKKITPDGVSWTDPYLDYIELDAMFYELKREVVNA